MTAAATPHSGDDPVFVEHEPLDDHRDEHLGNGLFARPLIGCGIIHAQRRVLCGALPAIGVFGWFAGPARVGTNQRIEDDNRNAGIV